MTEISIGYTVPVQVIVDVDAKTVTRVVVIDEGTAPDPFGYTEVHGDVTRLPTPTEIRAAQEIAADPEVEWPVWDMGW